MDGEAPKLDPHGRPEMVIAFLRRDQVEIIDAWTVVGLRGTGSHDLRTQNAFVPTKLAGPFALFPGASVQREGAMQRIPFPTLVVTMQVPPVSLGIARRAIEEFRETALTKMRPPAPPLAEQAMAQVAVARATALVESARAFYYGSIESLWEVAKAGDMSLDLRLRTRLACLTTAENCAAAVDLLYRIAGTTPIFQDSDLGRCWRDIHTAVQHREMQPSNWEAPGRVIMGLEPGTPMF
jgi:alkylation response protein AidB-like acyl-CoA dehydrogenase